MIQNVGLLELCPGVKSDPVSGTHRVRGTDDKRRFGHCSSVMRQSVKGLTQYAAEGIEAPESALAGCSLSLDPLAC